MKLRSKLEPVDAPALVAQQVVETPMVVTKTKSNPSVFRSTLNWNPSIKRDLITKPVVLSSSLDHLDSCRKCTKPVYFAEKIKRFNHVYHKWCFKCESCDRRINQGENLDRNHNPYCRPCYYKFFAPHGFRGGGDGTMVVLPNKFDLVENKIALPTLNTSDDAIEIQEPKSAPPPPRSTNSEWGQDVLRDI
uniref:LIM zinc-binding domain-containing protein n=1 Tax=Aplanochytrium stocchinoi TaxID=215587 RepID=A0A7S3LJN8_9STRA|mmetsp:Transcript_597/g.716  ORF Transcript_597/g.716 Transcript_597/m.716 type:complete len:191 (+) Transcript_597:111-683(+)